MLNPYRGCGNIMCTSEQNLSNMISYIKSQDKYKYQGVYFRTGSITPTTPAIEITPPCDVSFSAARRISFLVANLTMASSKD